MRFRTLFEARAPRSEVQGPGWHRYARVFATHTLQVRGQVLDMEKKIKLKLTEELLAKLSMWDKLPYSILGLAGGRFGYSEAVVKQRASQLLRDFDEQAAKFGSSKLHRVAVRMLALGTVFRAELEAWLASSRPIEHFVALHNEVVQYAMLPVVGRLIESEHARIQKNLKGREGRLPGSVNAALRAHEVDTMLDDPCFFGWAEAFWKKQLGMKNILSFKYSPTALSRMTFSELCKQIYLYDPAEQYKDTAVEAASLHEWSKSAEPMLRLPPVKHSVNMNLMLSYLKETFANGRIFSLPEALFMLASGDARIPLGTGVALEISGHDIVSFHDAFVGTINEALVEPDPNVPQQFFEVVNAYPERRKLFRPGTEQLNTAMVCVLPWGVERSCGHQVRVSSVAMPLRYLDLSRIASLQLVASLFAWRDLRPDSTLALSDAALHRIALVNTLVPESTMPPPDIVDQADIVPAFNPLARVLGDTVSVVQMLVDELAFVEDGLFMEIDRLPDMNHLALSRAASDGLVEMRTDEFGVVSAAISASMFQWFPALTVAGAQNNVISASSSADAMSSSSKLSLLAQLELLGCESGSMPLPPPPSSKGHGAAGRIA